MRTVFVLYCVICLIYVVVLSVRCFVVNFVDFYLLLVYFCSWYFFYFFFFFQAEDGIRDWSVTGVQTCALPILSWPSAGPAPAVGGTVAAIHMNTLRQALSLAPVALGTVIAAPHLNEVRLSIRALE